MKKQTNNYNFIFELGSRVKVKELNLKGRITGLFVGSGGIEYRVRYFINSDPKDVYFYDYELEKIDENDITLGFKDKE